MGDDFFHQGAFRSRHLGIVLGERKSLHPAATNEIRRHLLVEFDLPQMEVAADVKELLSGKQSAGAPRSITRAARPRGNTPQHGSSRPRPLWPERRDT
jgi:hypothetical protein